MKNLLATAITLTTAQSLSLNLKATVTGVDYDKIVYVTGQEECPESGTPQISYKFDDEHGTCTCWFTSTFPATMFGCADDEFFNPMHQANRRDDICLTEAEYKEFTNHDHGLDANCKPK